MQNESENEYDGPLTTGRMEIYDDLEEIPKISSFYGVNLPGYLNKVLYHEKSSP
jgi:hypothetical protein